MRKWMIVALALAPLMSASAHAQVFTEDAISVENQVLLRSILPEAAVCKIVRPTEDDEFGALNCEYDVPRGPLIRASINSANKGMEIDYLLPSRSAESYEPLKLVIQRLGFDGVVVGLCAKLKSARDKSDSLAARCVLVIDEYGNRTMTITITQINDF